MDRANSDTANGTPLAERPDALATPDGLHAPQDPWSPTDAKGAIESPPAGQPGHGRTALLRRKPGLVVNGRFEGGYTDSFEIICCECGDNPYADYSQITSRLRKIRGPYTMAAGIAAYEGHLGLTP